MFLKPNTNLTISNNRVKHAGGGICVEDQCMQSRLLCFFQYDIATEATFNASLRKTIHVHLINNTAIFAGDHIFGGSVDFCYMVRSNSSLKSYTDPYNSFHDFTNIFNFLPKTNNSITSLERHVCLCNASNQIDCHTFPSGPSEPVRRILQHKCCGGGPNEWTCAGTVYTNFSENDHHHLVHGQVQRITNRECTNLSYSFHCKNDRKTIATLVLSVQFVGDKSFQKDLKFYQPLMVNVLIKRCPLGFELRRETDYQKCDCLKNLSHVQCDINHKTIHRMKYGLWIGYMQ